MTKVVTKRGNQCNRVVSLWCMKMKETEKRYTTIIVNYEENAKVKDYHFNTSLERISHVFMQMMVFKGYFYLSKRKILSASGGFAP